MRAVVTTKTIQYGKQIYRLNNDKSYSIMAFGSTWHNQNIGWHWINIPEDKVPKEVKNLTNESEE